MFRCSDFDFYAFLHIKKNAKIDEDNKIKSLKNGKLAALEL